MVTKRILEGDAKEIKIRVGAKMKEICGDN
jgi:hypothetical protein